MFFFFFNSFFSFAREEAFKDSIFKKNKKNTKRGVDKMVSHKQTFLFFSLREWFPLPEKEEKKIAFLLAVFTYWGEGEERKWWARKIQLDSCIQKKRKRGREKNRDKEKD